MALGGKHSAAFVTPGRLRYVNEAGLSIRGSTTAKVADQVDAADCVATGQIHWEPSPMVNGTESTGASSWCRYERTTWGDSGRSTSRGSTTA